MKAKIVPMFDKYKLECNTATYIEISEKYGGFQKLSDELKECTSNGNEGKAIIIIADLLVSLINGAIKSRNYKGKKLNAKEQIEELISIEDIYYNYGLITILNAGELCMKVITDSLNFNMPDSIKSKPIDLTLKEIEEEEKKMQV